MATSDTKMMSCEPVARGQGVTPNQKGKRQSRAKHKKARDDSSPAHASDDGRESPTVDDDKKSKQRIKKAGEGTSNAPANDESRKSPSGDKKSKSRPKNAGEGLSKPQVVDEGTETPTDDEDEEDMAEGMTEDTTGTSAEIPEFLRIITDIHKIVTRSKAKMAFRLAIHDKLGELGALFNSIQEENTSLKAENRTLKEVIRIGHQNGSSGTTPAAPSNRKTEGRQEAYCVHIFLRRQRCQGDSKDIDNHSKSCFRQNKNS